MEAIEIFKLNVEAYPQSSNVYDSLGEAYMVKGDGEQAIMNYEISLKLDPNNSNAAEMQETQESIVVKDPSFFDHYNPV